MPSPGHKSFVEYAPKAPLLSPHFRNQGHVLVADNYYSSTGLIRRLFVDGVFYVGTTKSVQLFPLLS